MDGSRLVRGNADAQHLGRIAGEHLPGVAHAVLPVGQGVNPRHQVQAGVIVLGAVAVGNPALHKGGVLVQGNVQLSQGFVMAHGVGRADHVLGNQVLGLLQLAGKHLFLNERELFQGGPVVPVHKAAVPQAVLVELDPLDVRVAVHHGSQPAVSQRDGVVPNLGGSVVFHGPFVLLHTILLSLGCFFYA